ncbi:MFS transporter [Microbacterium sp. NPDC090007]|uniref:MFS transporter n=1 Tax=Microbacterium sp. NPDC090007 TaxID=3364204 RepID=UPI003830BBA1
MPLTTSSIPTTRAGTREWLALVVLTFAVVILAIDGTVLALAVPALVADLGATTTQILWIGDIYSFMLAGLLITAGNLADRIGRKRLLLIGAAGFGVASAIAAFSTTADTLIIARALLGVSGAAVMPSTLSLIRAMFQDVAQRTRAIAVWSAGTVGGAAAGPLVGGALLENLHWGAVFLINIPVVIVVVLAGAFLIPESKNPVTPRVDLLSAFLSILTIVPLVFAVKRSFSYGIDGWIAATAVLGIVSGVVFVLRQRRLETPLIDVRLFRIPAFSGAVAAITLTIFAFTGLLYFFSQYLQLVRGLGPFLAGVAELPMTVASMLVVVVVGLLVGRLGRGRAISSGLTIAAIGLAALAVAEGLEGYVLIGVALALVGLGAGIAMTLGTDAVVSVVPTSRAGAAASVSETAYELGIALGIAVLGSLQVAIYRGALTLPPELDGQTAATVRDSLAGAREALDQNVPLHADVFAHAQHAFTTGVQTASFIAAALLVVAAIVAWRVIPSDKTDVAVAAH